MSKKTCVAFSFDDARGDFWKAYKILAERNMAFALNVTTGYVDQTSPKEKYPCEKEPLTKKQVIEISRYPKAEIALHGNDHNNQIENICLGNQKLREWLSIPEDKKLGFASCNSRLSKEEYLKNEWLIQNTCYMRTTFRIKSLRLFRVWARKIGHFFPFPFLFSLAYGDTVLEKGDDSKIIYALPVIKEMSVSQLLALVRTAIHKGGHLVFMMHSIVDDARYEDDWSFSTAKFIALCDALKKLEEEGKIEIITCMDIHNRLKAEECYENQRNRSPL